MEPLLEKRLGREQFDPVPPEPGVYRFYDAQGQLLYVGKSKNLRRRLFSYKRAMPGQVSRKVSELISNIARFDFLVTDSEEAALLTENRIIRDEKPPFNHANKETETYYFVRLALDDDTLHFRMAMKLPENREGWYGCLKGHRPVRSAFGALLRLLRISLYRLHRPHDLPVQLTRNLTPLRCEMDLPPGTDAPLLAGLLHRWMMGESDELTDWFAVMEPGEWCSQGFSTRYMEHQLELIAGFYNRHLIRHRRLREQLCKSGNRLILQDELDDLVVKYRAAL